jgi:pimeloyl-ACP methyl ester carboxylesterase
MFLFLFLTAAQVFQAPPAKGSAWTAVDCREFKVDPRGARDVSCGYVTAPRRHAQPNGPTIQLATLVLASTALDREPDPLFVAQGGAGGSTIETYANYFIDNPDSRAAPNRDLVLWDQRGTLNSKPALMCPEVTGAGVKSALADNNPPDPSAPDPTQACYARLSSMVSDLSAFNSQENADDVDDVRQALGYERINFYGVSYGTELGQFVIRQHPERLNAVVLDAVVPLTYNIFTEPNFAQQRIGEKYLNGCAADPRCNTAFPNLAARFLVMLDRLDAQPVTINVAPLGEVPPEITALRATSPTGAALPRTNQALPIELSGGLLEGALYQSLYSSVHDYIPLIVDRAEG